MDQQTPPFKCIWCHQQEPQVEFDKSHVIPQCAGNNDYTVLPVGIVCKKCNGYFGSKVEPHLLDDPLFHVIAVALELTNSKSKKPFRQKIFDKQHPSEERIKRHLSLKSTLSSNKLSLQISHQESGVLSRQYNTRELAWLSRAIHKIGFEAMAWDFYVRKKNIPIPIFDNSFAPVRAWAREGHPTNSIRPLLRFMGNKPAPQLEYQMWIQHGHKIYCWLNLYGDWYGMNFTSNSNTIDKHLAEWSPPIESNDIWVISNEMMSFDKYKIMHQR